MAMSICFFFFLFASFSFFLSFFHPKLCTHIGYIAFRYILLLLLLKLMPLRHLSLLFALPLEIENRVWLILFYVLYIYNITTKYNSRTNNETIEKRNKKYVCFFFFPACVHCMAIWLVYSVFGSLYSFISVGAVSIAVFVNFGW